LAEENVRSQRARYEVGLATTKDLLDYTTRLTQAQAAEAEALARYNIDLAELRRVEGTLLSARNVVVEARRDEEPPWWARF
jgi:outer membrane protein TolC